MSALARLREAFVQDPVTRREVLQVAAFWMGIGLAYQILSTVNVAQWGNPLTGPLLIVALASQNVAFVPVSLVVRRAAQLWVTLPERKRLTSTAVVMVSLLFASYVSWFVMWIAIVRPFLVAWIPTLGGDLQNAVDARTHIANLQQAFWPFVVIAAYYTAAAYRGRMAENERAAAVLETELAKAQVAALRMQLNPHFLFNSLNVVSGLIEERPQQARSALAQLSVLLRGALKGASTDATLADEVAWLQRYLDLQRLRFEDRLDLDVDIEADVLEARVPSFLLQPLVENAFEHGVARTSRRGQVSILGRREQKRLVLDVRDNGPGLLDGDDPSGEPGMGVATTRERLHRLFGTEATLELANRAEGSGVRARITLPLITD
ncbi:MAG: histidine kinase [Bacteroidota bacterium]